MLHITLQHLDIFPTWLRRALIDASGLWLLLLICTGSLKLLQGPLVRRTLRSAAALLMNAGGGLKKVLEDPFEYPRIERFLEYPTVAVFYGLSGLLYVYFAVLMYLLFTQWKHLGLYQGVGVGCFSMICLVAAKAFKAEAGRCRLRLR